MTQQRILPAIWTAATMLFIGLVPQLMADVKAESNETDWAQTNGLYGGRVYTLYATPEGVLFAGMEYAVFSVQRISAILGHPLILDCPMNPERASMVQFLRKREVPSTPVVAGYMRQQTMGTRGITFQPSKSVWQLAVL